MRTWSATRATRATPATRAIRATRATPVIRVTRAGRVLSCLVTGTAVGTLLACSTPGGSGSEGDSDGWTVTVYYTAVQRYHRGPATRVTGCPTIECTRGAADLGTYPADFVAAVRDEGTGRTVSGRYLNWSYDTGYWLDDAPRDSDGGVLRPFRSAAADPGVLPSGTVFSLVSCGLNEEGGPAEATVCARLRQARWVVTDEFTPGLGGDRHLDLYIGEETGAGFTEGPWYATFVGVRLRTD